MPIPDDFLGVTHHLSFLSFCLSVGLSTCLSLPLSFSSCLCPFFQSLSCQLTFPSVCPFFSLSACLFSFLSVFPYTVFPSTILCHLLYHFYCLSWSVCRYFCLSFFLSFCLSFSLSFSFSIFILSAFLSPGLNVLFCQRFRLLSLFFCLSVLVSFLSCLFPFCLPFSLLACLSRRVQSLGRYFLGGQNLPLLLRPIYTTGLSYTIARSDVSD